MSSTPAKKNAMGNPDHRLQLDADICFVAGSATFW
jgi:hypothetical protein